MSPIRPENRKRYPPPAVWAGIRSAILERARPVGGDGRPIRGARPQCECRGECGRGTHAGRCPNLHGGFAYGSGATVVLTIAHLDHAPEHNDPANLRAFCQGCHLHYDREHHAQTRAATLRESRASAGQLTMGEL